VKRNLDFLELQKCEYPILILDGSSNVNQVINVETVKNSKLNVRHLSFSESINLGVRLNAGFQQVDTPYSTIIADDDFIFLDKMDYIINFLNSNPDYSSAIGKTFSLYRNRILGLAFYCFGNDLTSLYSQNASTALRRLVAHDVMTVIGYPPIYYSIKKTQVYKFAYSVANEKLQYGALERYSNALTLVEGKHKVFDFPTHLRDYDCPTIQCGMRDNPETYISSENMEYLKLNFENHLITQCHYSVEIAKCTSEQVFLDAKTLFVEIQENLINKKPIFPSKISKITQYLFYKFFSFTNVNLFNDIPAKITKDIDKVI
jgi:glycosyltransferase domain-containing protein